MWSTVSEGQQSKPEGETIAHEATPNLLVIITASPYVLRHPYVYFMHVLNIVPMTRLRGAQTI
eukprot:364639-Chlamydomonas_euryale.AAC.38